VAFLFVFRLPFWSASPPQAGVSAQSVKSATICD